jgi:hypothetical protein
MTTLLIQKGTTNVSVEVDIVDSGDGTPETGVVFNTSGIDLWYRRDGAAVSSITEATLAALTTAHTDGGFLHIQNGKYRLDLPDAACATGVDKVVVGGTVTGMVVYGPTIQLVDYDPFDSVRMGITALPNAAADAAGGLPISDAGGLDLDAMNTNINDIETDTSDMQPKLGTPAGASISADIATIDSNVDAVLVDTGTTLDGKLDTIDTNVDAVLVDTGTTLPTTLTTIEGKIDTVDTNVDSVLVDTGTTLDGKLDTVDTVVDAIKAKTDDITFTKANEVDVNVQSVNDQTITGNGGSGTEFQGA